MKLKVEHVASHAELYHPRSPTDTPRVFVELDCQTGKLNAYSEHPALSGTTPRKVHNRLAHRWAIPELRAQAANELLDEIAPLAQLVLDGFSEDRDSQDRWGRYTQAAQDAVHAINDLTLSATPHETLVVYRADEWFGTVGDDAAVAAATGITAATSDAELAVISDREADTQTEDCDLILGVSEYLTALRDRLRQAASEGVE